MQQNSLPTNREMTERRVCSSAPEMDPKDHTSSARRGQAHNGPLLQPTPGLSLSVRELEMKNSVLRRKLTSVEEEKASLLLENRQLISELEAVQLELASSKTKVRVLGSAVGSKTSSVSLMKEEIEGLEAELEAQGHALRDAERRLEETQETLVMRNRQVDNLREELGGVRAELDDKTNQGIRVEQQRTEVLINAEKQTLALQEYKANVSGKFKKMLDNEAILKKSLIQCDKERAELDRKCSQLEQEGAEMSKHIGQLKEDSVRAEATSLESASLRSSLDEAALRGSELERRLAEREAEAREAQVLRRENGELRLLTGSQEQRLEQCHREAQESRAELASLEAILSVLHLRESGGGLPCAQTCLPLPVSPSHIPNLKPGERYQQLLPALRAVEQERQQQAELARGLQERLGRAQEELSSLQSSLGQRDHHLLQLQGQLQDTATQVAQLERELRRKSSCLAASEQQLDERVSAHSLAVEKNNALEQNLLETSNSIQQFKSALNTKNRDLQQALEQSQRICSDQCKELEEQIRLLQLTLEQKHTRIAALERALSAAQQEREEAQHRADRLQTSFTQLSQETETNTKRDQETLRDLTAQAAQSTTKVKCLEMVLSSCKEELSSCLKQMEKAEGSFEKQLESRAKEVEALQLEVRSSTLACQSSSEQNLQLQYTVQRQQAMLQESTAHASELEDSQELLFQQVARLEKKLEKEKTLASKELKEREQKAQEASQQAERHRREAAQLSSSVTQLTTDLSECRAELSEREKDLLLIGRAGDAKASQLGQMEKMLQQTKGMLDKKAETVTELEEKVRSSRRDRRNSLQRTQLLESQMKTVRGELVDTLHHLQELRAVLQRSQHGAEERKAAMDKLAAEHRETRGELDQRIKEVQDKDTALKETQEELQQRVLQLSQLEVAIRDHKVQMEQKLIHLQGALERSEREVNERTKQVEFLSERLELVRVQLQGKESLEQESQVRALEEEQWRMEERAAQGEARLQASVSSLTQELDTLRKQHQAELLAVQESQVELLKASDCVSSTLRSSQDLLSQELQHCRAQVDEAHRSAAALLAELGTREQLLQNTSETLLLKESEVTRLKTKMSSLERSMELQSITLRSGLPPAGPNAKTHPLPPPSSKQETRRSTAGLDWPKDGSMDLSWSLKESTLATMTPQYSSNQKQIPLSESPLTASKGSTPDSTLTQQRQGEPSLKL